MNIKEKAFSIALVLYGAAAVFFFILSVAVHSEVPMFPTAANQQAFVMSLLFLLGATASLVFYFYQRGMEKGIEAGNGKSAPAEKVLNKGEVVELVMDCGCIERAAVRTVWIRRYDDDKNVLVSSQNANNHMSLTKGHNYRWTGHEFETVIVRG